MLGKENNMSPLPPDRKKIRIIKQAGYFDQKLLAASGVRKAALLIRRQFQPYYFMQPPLWRILLRAALTDKRMMPDFFSIGAVRSGTTLLSDLILQHPCIALPLAKEIGIRETPLFKLLRAQFPVIKEKKRIEQLYGNALTGFCSPIVPSMLFSYLAPNMNAQGKVVLIMRNPVERTFSHWAWDQSFLKKVKKDPLWQNFPDFPSLIDAELDAALSSGSSGVCLTGVGAGGYTQHSIYLPFIKSLYKTFGKEKVMLINADEFFIDPGKIVKRVYRFLQLPDYDPVEMPVHNASSSEGMDAQTREKLSKFFAPLNKQLYDFIGEDYGWN